MLVVAALWEPGGQGVAGSNPVSPTTLTREIISLVRVMTSPGTIDGTNGVPVGPRPRAGTGRRAPDQGNMRACLTGRDGRLRPAGTATQQAA